MRVPNDLFTLHNWVSQRPVHHTNNEARTAIITPIQEFLVPYKIILDLDPETVTYKYNAWIKGKKDSICLDKYNKKI